jgi:hypothetical protein
MPRLAVLLLFISLATGCASNPPSNPLPEQYYFDCDVPAGHFSSWTRSLNASSVRVSGNLQVLEVREDPKWSPGANIFLVNAQGTATAGFQLAIYNRNPEQITAFLYDQLSAEKQVLVATSDWRGKVISFDLVLSNAGVLKISFNGISQTKPLGDFRLGVVKFTCSTGQFKFLGLTIASDSR